MRHPVLSAQSTIRPWYLTVFGWLKLLRPQFILPSKRQYFQAVAFHFAAAFLCGPVAITRHFLNRKRFERHPRNVIFVSRFHLGDFLMSVPALLFARHQLGSNVKIAIILQQRYAEQMELSEVCDSVLPEIDERAPFLEQFRLWRRRLGDGQYDAIVFHRITRPDLPAILAAFIENVPQRVGGSDKGHQALLTHVYHPTSRKKVARYHLELVAAWLGCEVSITDLKWPALTFLDEKVASNFDLLIAPFAQHSKVWPQEKWESIVRVFADRGLRIALSAGANAIAESEAFLNDLPEVINLAPSSRSVSNLFQQVAAARCVVAVDTGIRHVAAAVGTPCIVLGHGREHKEIMGQYVPTERYLYNPVPCAPCGAEPCPLEHLNCIRGISVEAVLAAMRELVPDLLDDEGRRESAPESLQNNAQTSPGVR